MRITIDGGAPGAAEAVREALLQLASHLVAGVEVRVAAPPATTHAGLVQNAAYRVNACDATGVHAGRCEDGPLGEWCSECYGLFDHDDVYRGFGPIRNVRQLRSFLRARNYVATSVDRWCRTKHPSLGHLTPDEVVESGREAEVRRLFPPC